MENTGGGEPNTTDSIDVLKCLRCGQEGCSNVPAFGYHGEGPTLCSEHATPVMVQLVALRCEQAGCNARRTFGFDGGEARLCANHKLEGMVDLMKRRSQCVISNCTKLSTYGYDGLLARYCFSHKSSGMVYLKNRKRCEYYECTRQPTYGMDGQRAKFCSSHKEEGMIDVKNCRCKHPGCTRQPNYGHEGGRAKYCSSHKLAKMVNVVSRRCEFPACKRQPIYGYEGEKATFCPMHRLDSMMDVVNRHCEYPGCTKTPSYGYVGERAQFCSHHHLPDMEDVKNRRCEWHECRRYPIFGHEGERARFCSAHKSEDMVNVRNRRCEDGSCNKLPTHGPPGEKAKACQAHAKPGMVNLKGRKSVPVTTLPKREGDVNIRLGPIPHSGGLSARTAKSPEHNFDTGVLGGGSGVGAVGGGGGSGSGPSGDRQDQMSGYWSMGHRGFEGRGAAGASAGASGGIGRGTLGGDGDLYGSKEGPMMGWGMRGVGAGVGAGGVGADGTSANPSGVLGDRKLSVPESQQMRLRKLTADVDLRDQRAGQERHEREMKEQQIRAMQSSLHQHHRRTVAASALDTNFYGSQAEYTHSYDQVGAPHRPLQQHFVQGGGSSSAGIMQRRPLPREDLRSSPQVYRDHIPQQQPRGYGNLPDYGFLGHQVGGSASHGYGSGAGGEGDDPLPVSGVLGGRVSLRPPQSRIPVQHPRARRPLPPSPPTGRGVPGISSVMDASLEGGRYGGSLSPFLGHQLSSQHLRPPLPSNFSAPFQPLDWGEGAGVGGGGSEGGGHGGQRDSGVALSHMEYSHQHGAVMGVARSTGGDSGGLAGDDERGSAGAAGASSLDMGGSGVAGAGGAGAGGGFGGRLSNVDLGQGMMQQHFGRDVSPGPFLGTEVNGGDGDSHGPSGTGTSMASAPGSVNDVSVPAGAAGRPLSPLMTSLGDPVESPPDLPRLRAMNSNRSHDHPIQSSYAPPYLPVSTASSSTLASGVLTGLQNHPVGAPPGAPGVGLGRPSPPAFEGLSGAVDGGTRSVGGDVGHAGYGGRANTGSRNVSAAAASGRGSQGIDGRNSREGRPGGGRSQGKGLGLYSIASSGVVGGETALQAARRGRSLAEGGVGGSGGLGDVGGGGGNDEADGDDARKRLRIEELLH